MVKGVPKGAYQYIPVKNTVMYPHGHVPGQAEPVLADEPPDALPDAEPVSPPAVPAVPPPPEAELINDIEMRNAVPAPDADPQPAG